MQTENLPPTTNPPASQSPPVAYEASLDDEETTGRFALNGCRRVLQPPETPELNFRHSGWTKQRTLVHEALKRLYETGERPDRFALCGANAWVFRDPMNPDNLVIKATHCHDRWCKPCQAHRSFLIRSNLEAHARGRNVRFVTLTVQHGGRTLAQGIDHLLRSFSLLRRSRTWKERTSGGVALLEVKRSKTTAQWHPHLHAIVEGKFMSQAALSAAWKAITKDSVIVDIRQVNQLQDLTRYVTKYVTKPASASVYTRADDLQEAILALHGRRTMITFGTWYGVDFLAHDLTIDWQPVAPLSVLLEKARNGEAFAFQIVSHLRSYTEWKPRTERPPPGTCT